jgi:hypothetical protein
MYIVDENRQKITINKLDSKENYDDSVVIAGRMIKKNHLIIAGIIVAIGVVMLGYFIYKYYQSSESGVGDMDDNMSVSGMSVDSMSSVDSFSPFKKGKGKGKGFR